MAISIHHGPPGSYKSFTCVMRFAIDALKKGRVVITNIRGFNTIDRVKKSYSGIVIPETAQIIHISSSNPENRLILASWWKWAPFGSLLILDEAQFIYPKDVKIKDIEKFDSASMMPFEVEQSFHDESRPISMPQAFDMHRHFNWDLFLCTPNINKINKEIRGSSETAFRHKNMGTFVSFLKGYWLEFQHDPETSGKSPFHFIGSPSRYKFDIRAGNCYDSTLTGEHSQSVAGKPFYKQTKILLMFAIAFFGVYRFATSATKVYEDRTAILNKTDQIPTQPGNSSDSNVPNNGVNHPLSITPDHVAVAPPSTLSDYERKVKEENSLIHRLMITGFELSDFEKLPQNCKPYISSIKCTLPRLAVKSYSNYFCMQEECYLLLFPKPKPKETQSLTIPVPQIASSN